VSAENKCIFGKQIKMASNVDVDNKSLKSSKKNPKQLKPMAELWGAWG
jgi:hypothetical protein